MDEHQSGPSQKEVGDERKMSDESDDEVGTLYMYNNNNNNVFLTIRWY